MSSNTVAAATASSHRPGHCSSLPACILLNSSISISTRLSWNTTTAVAETSNKLTVEVSLSLSCPPALSNLSLYCPGADFTVVPKIIFTAEDLILIRVAVGRSHTATLANCDYFIYRAGAYPKSPSLTLIPNPKPHCFGDGVVGVLPRGGELYTIAALLITGADEYKLHRFDSESGSWVSKAVSLEAPRRPFPSSFKTRWPHYHTTSMVIMIGGVAATMGWVDLWGGVLFCDLLHEDRDRPALRHLPLPLPKDIIAIKDPKGVKLNCPDSRRGVFSLIKNGKACLKLADLQITSERLPYTDIETGWPAFAVDNWAITVWSNSEISGSYEDWHEDFTVRASDIKINNEVRLQLQKSGLLHRKPSRDDEDVVEIALRNLVVFEPNVSLNGEEYVVYVTARTKFMHPKAWVLAIDLRNCTLLDVADFGTENVLEGFSYRPGTISTYMNPRVTPGVKANTGK